MDLLLLTLATVTLDAVVVWRSYEAALLDQRAGVAAVLIQTLQNALESLPPEALSTPDAEALWLRRILDPFESRDLGLESAAVFDAEGRLRFAVGPLPQVDQMDDELKGALEDRQEIISLIEGGGFAPMASLLQITAPVQLRTGERWAARVRMPLVEAPGVLSRLQRAILGILLANAVLVGVLGYLLLRRRLLTPIAELATAVGLVTAGELTQRVEIERNDELGELARRFNQMVAALADYRRRLEEQLRSLEEANKTLVKTREELVASEKLASVGRLAAGVAHEVGNPLAAIMGFVEVLLSDAPPGMERDTLTRVQTEVARIDRIMGEMLDLAKPPRGVVERRDARAIMEDLLAFLQHQPGMGGIALERRWPDALAEVLVMPEKVRQGLLNLILNAVHAMEGAGTLRIEMAEVEGPEGVPLRAGWRAFAPSALPAGARFVAVTVADTGPGIPPAHMAEIFDPFFTTKEPGEGTGLGLSVTLGLMEAQGGAVQVQSKVGVGAAVTLLLPIAPEEGPQGDAEGEGGS